MFKIGEIVYHQNCWRLGQILEQEIIKDVTTYLVRYINSNEEHYINEACLKKIKPFTSAQIKEVKTWQSVKRTVRNAYIILIVNATRQKKVTRMISTWENHPKNKTFIKFIISQGGIINGHGGIFW